MVYFALLLQSTGPKNVLRIDSDFAAFDEILRRVPALIRIVCTRLMRDTFRNSCRQGGDNALSKNYSSPLANNELSVLGCSLEMFLHIRSWHLCYSVIAKVHYMSLVIFDNLIRQLHQEIDTQPSVSSFGSSKC